MKTIVRALRKLNWGRRALAVVALCIAAAIALPAQTFTTLSSFDSSGVSALIQATDGNFYGATVDGGANCAPSGCGTVVKITPSGTLTTLYNFCSQNGCSDGYSPLAGLIQASDGNFYGTTQYGGSDAYGTVFSLSVGLSSAVPAVNPGGVLNSASYTTQGVAPGSIVSIFGTNLAASAAVASSIPLPTTLSDVSSVTLNGIPAGLYFVSQNQINAQLPFDVLLGHNSGTVNIVVTRSSGASALQSVTVVPASPGIFTTTANGLGQAFAYVAASDGILRYTLLTPTVLIGGVPAQPVYSVLSPQFVSEYQIGVIPAANTPTGDTVSLQITVGGVTTTNQVTIAVAP